MRRSGHRVGFVRSLRLGVFGEGLLSSTECSRDGVSVSNIYTVRVSQSAHSCALDMFWQKRVKIGVKSANRVDGRAGGARVGDGGPPSRQRLPRAPQHAHPA